MIKLPKRKDGLKPFVTLNSNCSLFVQIISFMDIEYTDNDIDRFDGWMDGWIVHVNESNFADLSEDETVVVLPSCPNSNGVRVNSMPIY